MSWRGALQPYRRCMFRDKMETNQEGEVQVLFPISLSGAGSENPQQRDMDLHQIQIRVNFLLASFLNHPKYHGLRKHLPELADDPR